MIKALNKASFGKLAWLSPLVMLLGVYGGTTNVLPLPWIWLVLCGSLALYLQFGNTDVRTASLQKMPKDAWKIIVIAILGSFFFTYLSLFVGKG